MKHDSAQSCILRCYAAGALTYQEVADRTGFAMKTVQNASMFLKQAKRIEKLATPLRPVQHKATEAGLRDIAAAEATREPPVSTVQQAMRTQVNSVFALAAQGVRA